MKNINFSFVFGLFVFTFFALPAFGQLVCDQAGAPALRGLRLGQTKEEIKQIIGEMPATEYENKFMPSSYLLKKNPDFADVDRLTITFFENKAGKIFVDYDNSIKWRNAAEFLLVLSEKLDLPPAAWNIEENRTEARLVCRDFVLLIDSAAASVELTDKRAARDEITVDRTKDSEKKKNFKP